MLAILIGAIFATVAYFVGSSVLWWAVHDGNQSFLKLLFYGWLTAIPTVAILAGWLTYRMVRGRRNSVTGRAS